LKHQSLATLGSNQIQNKALFSINTLQIEHFPIAPKPVFWENNPVSFRQAACHIKKIEF